MYYASPVTASHCSIASQHPLLSANFKCFATLALIQSAGGAYTWDATFSLAFTPSLDREMFSGSVDAGFVLALPFHHGDIEPDCVGVSTREGELISARLCVKNVYVGGLMCEGGRICRTLWYKHEFCGIYSGRCASSLRTIFPYHTNKNFSV